MSTQRQPVGLNFFLLWLLLTTVGWTLGLAVLAYVPWATSTPLIEGLCLAAAGSLVFFLQALLLRRTFSHAGRWALAGAAGWTVGLLVAIPYLALAAWYLDASQTLIRELVGVSIGTAVGILIGALAGTAQWLILRGRVRRAGTWIGTSTLGWAVALGIFALTPETGAGALVVGGLVGGAVLGAVTGGMLLLLVRPPSTHFVSLRVQFVLLFVLMFTAGVAGAFFWFYNYSMGVALRERAAEMEALLQAAAATIDGTELLALYREQGDELDDPRYHAYVQWLESLRADRPYTLYTLVPTDVPGQLAVVVDVPAEDASHPPASPGEVYSLPAEDPIWQGFEGTLVDTGDPITFRSVLDAVLWHPPADVPPGGTRWSGARRAPLSGFAPIRDVHGTAVGLVGADFQADALAAVRAGVLGAMRRSFVDLFGFILLVSFFVARSVTRPILTMTEAARRIGRGQYEQDLSHLREESFFHHELDELAEAIEQSGRVHLSERRLRKEVAALKIEIDEARRQRQVSQIVEDDFFKDLQARAREMRAQREEDAPPPAQDEG